MDGKNIYLAAEGRAKTWKEAIELCGKYMMEEGMVDFRFIDACIEREKEYPTGLPSVIPVAIPHSKAEGIKQNCVCFLRLDKPVRFYRMDDTDQYCDTKLIFNLAMRSSDGHLEFLQNLMKFVLNRDMLSKCSQMPLDKIPDFLEQEME